jgi:hypothetical protein
MDAAQEEVLQCERVQRPKGKIYPDDKVDPRRRQESSSTSMSQLSVGALWKTPQKQQGLSLPPTALRR